jgi:hypothetical protein
MRMHELRNSRGHMRHAKRKWRADPEHAAKASPGIKHFLLRGLQFVEYRLTSFIEPLANLIEIHPAGCALDERRAQPDFQVFQAAADGGHSNPKSFSSLSEASCFDHHDKRADFLNLAHNVAVYIIILKIRIIFSLNLPFYLARQ